MAGDPFGQLMAKLPGALRDPELLAAARELQGRFRLRCGTDAVDIVAASGVLHRRRRRESPT